MTLSRFVSTNHPQQTAKRGPSDEVDDRGTDPAFIASLEDRFGKFTLDVAAAPHNAKAPAYYTRQEDGLTQPWTGRVWCNPPYSDIRSWVEKAWSEWSNYKPIYEEGADGTLAVVGQRKRPELIVMLLPANRTEQKWWQDLVEPRRDRPSFGNPRRIPVAPFRVEFLPGRMRFDRPDWTPGPKGDRPPFGCCLLIWGGAK